jgi:hypothetical protein
LHLQHARQAKPRHHAPRVARVPLEKGTQRLLLFSKCASATFRPSIAFFGVSFGPLSKATMSCHISSGVAAMADWAGFTHSTATTRIKRRENETMRDRFPSFQRDTTTDCGLKRANRFR